MGSLIGAVTAKPPEQPAHAVPPAVAGAATIEPRYTATKEYWTTVLVMSLLVFPPVMYVISEGEIDGDGAGVWALAYALLFPAIQLASSIVAAIRMSWSTRPGKQERMRHLQAITVRAFLGGLIGVGVMVPMLAFL